MVKRHTVVKKPPVIEHWCIMVKWSDKKRETALADMPDDVAQPIDDWLTELEQQENEVFRHNEGR